MVWVLDSSAVSFLAQRSAAATEMLAMMHRRGLWPPRVPTPVLVECLTGQVGRDVVANRLLRSCVIEAAPSESLARQAAVLRTRACRGSAVDAIVVAAAEPDGVVLTSDVGDLGALAASTRGVRIVRV